MPRAVQRPFPDVTILVVATLQVIPQSRLTFSGQRGTVIAGWQMQQVNDAGISVNQVGVQLVGTAIQGVNFNSSFGWTDAVVGRSVGAWVWALLVDPAEGSFLEAVAAVGGLRIQQDTGRVIALSFPSFDEAGPTVTIA